MIPGRRRRRRPVCAAFIAASGCQTITCKDGGHLVFLVEVELMFLQANSKGRAARFSRKLCLGRTGRRFSPTGNTAKTRRLFCPTCQALSAKIIVFPKGGSYDLTKPFRPFERDVRPSSRHVGRDAMDAAVRRRCATAADGQAVWSCPLDAGVKFAEMIGGRRWLKSPIRRGEHGAAAKSHRAGNAGSSGDLW